MPRDLIRKNNSQTAVRRHSILFNPVEDQRARSIEHYSVINIRIALRKQ